MEFKIRPVWQMKGTFPLHLEFYFLFNTIAQPTSPDATRTVTSDGGDLFVVVGRGDMIGVTGDAVWSVVACTVGTEAGGNGS